MTIIKAQIEDRIRSDRRALITSFIRDIPLLKEDHRIAVRRSQERDNAAVNQWLIIYLGAKGATSCASH